MTLETQTLIAAPAPDAPRYLTLPFQIDIDTPSTKPAWFLAGFSEWIDGQCSDAQYQLRRLSFRTIETDVDAIHALKDAGLSCEKSPFDKTGTRFLNLALLPEKAVETLNEFFWHHIEVARGETTLRNLAFSHEMVLDYAYAHVFDGERESEFEAQFGAYLEQSHVCYQEKWKASGLSVDSLIAFILSGEKPSPWYGAAAPESGQEWADEFAAWLRDKGVERSHLRQYIPRFPADEFAAMKATGHKMSSLYLVSGDELRFLCDDPRAFVGWGALFGYWQRFLDCGVRAPAYLAWTARNNTKDAAPAMDDGISELEAI